MKILYSKKRLFGYWVLGGFLSSVPGVVIAVIFWANQKTEWQLDPVSEIIASTIMLPVGWAFCALIPMALPASAMAWLSIAGFIWACKAHRWQPLFLSFGACLAFGLFWPTTFWTMMSV